MNVKGILIFAIGALTGGGITYISVRRKYEMKAKREIEEIRDYYAKKYGSLSVEKEEDEVPEMSNEERIELRNENQATYADIIKEANYSSEPNMHVGSKPRIIKPTDFGNTGYDTCSLVYYPSDDTVMNLDDHIWWDDDDVENFIGQESLLHFGEYEDNLVYVRNDFLKLDYEITLSED